MATGKQISPQEDLRCICRDIREEARQWENIREGRGWDPSWPDGVNLNLIRRHIIHGMDRAAEVCMKHGLPLPEECLLPVPPEVDSAFMADPSRKVLVPYLRAMAGGG